MTTITFNGYSFDSFLFTSITNEVPEMGVPMEVIGDIVPSYEEQKPYTPALIPQTAYAKLVSQLTALGKELIEELSNAPVFIPSWIENHLEEFQKAAKACEFLDLSNCSLKEWPFAILKHFPHLKTLSLTNNALTSLPQELPHPMPELKELNLSCNKLSSLPFRLSFSFPSLEKLQVSFNCLTKLPQDLKHFPKLVHLDLNHNCLSYLPEGLQGALFTHVSLYHNQLRKEGLWNILCSWKNLVACTLDDNPIGGTLPCDIAALSQLKKFDARDCQISEIDLGAHRFLTKLVAIGQIPKKDLDLTHNLFPQGRVKMGQVPSPSSYLRFQIPSAPRFFPISSNECALYQAVFDTLYETFDAEELQIAKIPRDISSKEMATAWIYDNVVIFEQYTSQITKLNLTNCDLYRWPQEILAFFPHLKRLNLRGNNLTQISNQTIYPELERLYLSHNECTQLPVDFGTLFPSLKILDLSSNHLKMIPDSLSKCQQLEALYLCENDLVSLPKSLKSLPLLDLDLADNFFPNTIWESVLEWKDLENLDLEGNPLGDVPAKELLKLNKLNRCLLKNCGINHNLPDVQELVETLVLRESEVSI